MSGTDKFDNPYTRRMASYVSALTYDEIPEDVLGRLKLLILDDFGQSAVRADGFLDGVECGWPVR